MIHSFSITFLIAFIYCNQYLVQATVFSCNTTVSCGCSRFNANINARIVGGEPAANHSWGWAVSVRDFFGGNICGGTILSRYYVLTAAHCVADMILSPALSSIVVGTDSLNSSEGKIIISSKIFIHPNYNSKTKENDIAILYLSIPIDFHDVNVAKICLPLVSKSEQFRYPIIKKPVVAIGWGLTSYDGDTSNFLRQVTVKTVQNNEKTCKNLIRNVNLQFCAGVTGGGKDTCQGDSGGPLMYYSESEQIWILAGITSYGFKCALPNYAGVYTRVSVYIDWIQSIVGDDATIFQCKSTDLCGCSRNNVDINFGIIGGETVAYRSWGWAVSVRNSNDMHICGGTILSKKFILTAAHCFRKISEEYLPYSVAMGIDSLLSSNGQIRIVSQIFIHPKWNLTSNENDIAILKLNASISMDDINIGKICLPNVIKSQRTRYPILYSTLITIGWGVPTWEDFLFPMNLRQVTLEAIDSTDSKCNNIIKNIHLQFCAAVKGGGKNTCQGDSGGPIMYFSTHKQRWILTGIISYGYRCALRDYTGVYTRISMYIDWIKLIVGYDGIVIVEESNAIINNRSNIRLLILLLYFLYLSNVNTISL
ncbi:unnamed protein product [Adineta steineri]|uniref:Peptidase S1 domain-containing protein n=1 Tax=Adineta steineri TaxID=433720 RepID=A0A819EB41_9BILA|nr:unnamed protein product [Adineta steineri]